MTTTCNKLAKKVPAVKIATQTCGSSLKALEPGNQNDQRLHLMENTYADHVWTMSDLWIIYYEGDSLIHGGAETYIDLKVYLL